MCSFLLSFDMIASESDDIPCLYSSCTYFCIWAVSLLTLVSLIIYRNSGQWSVLALFFFSSISWFSHLQRPATPSCTALLSSLNVLESHRSGIRINWKCIESLHKIIVVLFFFCWFSRQKINILGLVCWCSRPSVCLWHWHPIRVLVQVPATQLLIQLPAWESSRGWC